ncbi:MAG: undecaprenyl-diphosphate phosphatase [Candidatus Baldrarchaeia archaeon]
MSWETFAKSLLAVILGIIQGCLEWIPVSSEAFIMIYLITIVKLDPSTALAVSLLLHISTMFTVLLFFRGEFKNVLKTLVNMFNRNKVVNARDKSIFNILLTSFVGSAISGGAIFTLYINILNIVKESFLEFTGFIVLALIGIMMIITGLIMKKPSVGFKQLEEVSCVDGLLGGLVQGLAVFPGVSRSGVTITFFLYRKLKKDDALRCSFLIYIPAVILSTSYYLLLGDVTIALKNIGTSFFIIAFLSTFVVSLITMKSFIYAAKRLSFSNFLIFLGILIFALNVFALISMG